MAHWFHRNPYKATASNRFDVSKITTKGDFLKAVYALRDTREELLRILVQNVTTPERIDDVSGQYMALVQGLFEVPIGSEQQGQNSTKSAEAEATQSSSTSAKEENTPEEQTSAVAPPAGKDQVLNTFFRFKWTQSLHVDKPAIAEFNAKFDMINMSVNVALWYSKYASKLAAQAEISMEDAKTIHTCLRKAAGIFREIKNNQLNLLSQPGAKTSDLDPSILDAYIYSCQAEAQEVTIARAVEKKHTAKLIAGLANETSKLFQQADDVLKTREQPVVGKWRKYLQLKEAFYKSYAMCYYGVSLLECEKCGDSVRVLQDGCALLDKATKLCGEYREAKGAGSTIKPNEHSFYINFRKELQRHFEKSKNENGFIYHQKIPPVSPSLEVQATHGLVEPIEFTTPTKSSLWTSSAYAGFSISKNVSDSKRKSSQKDSPIQPVKEPDIKVTKDGCVIS